MRKTSYEMRISDWSSDVCSSDLLGIGGTNPGLRPLILGAAGVEFGLRGHLAAGEAMNLLQPVEVGARLHRRGLGLRDLRLRRGERRLVLDDGIAKPRGVAAGERLAPHAAVAIDRKSVR